MSKRERLKIRNKKGQGSLYFLYCLKEGMEGSFFDGVISKVRKKKKKIKEKSKNPKIQKSKNPKIQKKKKIGRQKSKQNTLKRNLSKKIQLYIYRF
jgi:hypothetical protein